MEKRRANFSNAVRLAGLLLALMGPVAWARVSVKLESDAQLTSLSGSERKFIKSGETIELSRDESYWLDSLSGGKILLLPLDASETLITLKPSDLSSDGGDARIGAAVSQVLSESKRIEQLLSQRRAQPAAVAADTLLRKYPNVAYLYFLKASSLLLLGNKPAAAEALKAGLALEPGNVEGRNMLDVIGGKRQ